MIITKETMPTLVENATMQKVYRDGVFKNYYIQANEGYILHDKDLDFTRVIDFETFESELMLGFTTGLCSCFHTYDWDVNPREFYCVPDNGDIPADQIFSDTNNDHEIA